MAEVVSLDAMRPHRVMRVICLVCAYWHVSVHPVEADPAHLECPACGAMQTAPLPEPPGAGAA